MIVVDANLLIYAVDSTSPFHSKAKRWIEASLSGAEPVAFAWPTLLAFLRLTTRSGPMRNPISAARAFQLVDAWLDRETASIIEPGPDHRRLFRELLLPLGTAGNLTSDAHLAVIAIEHRATLCSTDNDFARFPGLRWMNPLA